ncbi:MAG: galactokinase [Candidatus Hodarchaeota archaeon]
MNKQTRIKRIIDKLREMEKVDKKNIKIAAAPGRINLIGEHTDYNEGFVFPCAVSKENILAAMPSITQKIKVYSLNYNEFLQFSLDDMSLTGSWIDYLKGVVFYLKEEGYEINGITGVLHSNVPIGGGLSSSAALEVVTAFIFKLLYDLEIDYKELALICYKAERIFLDISCGIMDQFISALGKENCFLYLDCRPPYSFEQIKLPRDDVRMVIMDTKIHRAASNVVNTRRQECYEGVEIIRKKTSLNIKSLRDITIEKFEEIKKILPQPIHNRCKHVIYENQRVIKAKEAIIKGDFKRLGNLMYKSHYSLDTLYEVSCKELNTMVKIAKDIDGVIGARMTGAGLGGCACCICYDWATEELINKAKKGYEKELGMKPDIYSSNISDGVKELKNVEE